MPKNIPNPTLRALQTHRQRLQDNLTASVQQHCDQFYAKTGLSVGDFAVRYHLSSENTPVKGRMRTCVQSVDFEVDL